ncbi:MAG: acetate--CoA ligase family protein [Proteobacteria bacterium]|nr:acetate--CoA ligase family protein [Pseudomonadota bacterium]
MNFEEHAAKPLLEAAGIAVPKGRLVTSAEEASSAAAELGASVIKAQVPAGKRGKAGGIRMADTPDEAATAADAILAMEIGGHAVERLLVEERIAIAREFYAAVLNDASAKSPVVLFSTLGGMDIEDAAAKDPRALKRCVVDIREGFGQGEAERMLGGLDLGLGANDIAKTLVALYRLYRQRDAEMIEINPLALTEDGGLVALDCKFTLDDAAIPRQPDLAALGAKERLSALEARGRELGLQYIELDGDVGVLANGAGLTMATMDAVRHFGGRPANFLEVGGQAYTLTKSALELALANPRVKSLVVNFCGAFARTDVMTEGVVTAWEELKPAIPVFFSIHGTGEEEAVALLRARLGMEPFDLMDDAIKAAIEAAR